MADETLFGTPVRRDPVLNTRDYDAPRTLLYIEDTVAIVQVITAMLTRRPSVSVVAAHSGQEGLEIARTTVPDLVLLDLDLPDMSGADVVRALLSDPVTRSIPVVILSADATREQFDRLLRIGARAYLTKPVTMATLLDTVDMHILPVGVDVEEAPSAHRVLPAR